jgi:hypothetical protein
LKQAVASLLIAALFISCAASLPYGIDYPLTAQSFRSRDGVFSARVPQGWFSSTGDTLVPALVAWLVKDDLSAAVGVKELSLDREAAHRVEKDGLGLLASIDASLRAGGSDSAGSATEPKEFELQGKKFCSYETSAGGKLIRVVVFAAGGRFYACEAGAVKGRTSAEETVRMFTAQQTFLSTMKF